MSKSNRFAKVAGAGIAFQAGSAAVDSATIMSALVFQLTGSPIIVGAVTAILRFGWLAPQLFVGYFAQRSGSSMGYYAIGALGRAICMALLALILLIGSQWTVVQLSIAVMVLWTAYSFISGVVAVPYNDIVARSIPSEFRSRLLATRFFGGGVLALGVIAIADVLVGNLEFPVSYAAIIAMASILMFISSIIFITMGEPKSIPQQSDKPGFFEYLRKGIAVFQTDRVFRLFVFAQWCGGAVLMAMPFYIVQASAIGFDLKRIALLLGAQTVGALLSNFLWGWWGDNLGKASLLKAIAIGRVVPPIAIIVLVYIGATDAGQIFSSLIAIFFLLGALANGLTIAVIGFLMEISPEKQRPAYSGYFNAITAPAFLLPLIAGFIASGFGLSAVFAISLIAAIAQAYLLLLINKSEARQPGNFTP
ncbi:MAG: MFS transporter [Rhizobiaceae bacterium]|nr:MFS transporter [Rhizobiaceae bacterium]